MRNSSLAIPFHFYTSLSESYRFTFMSRLSCRPSGPFRDVCRSISLDIAQPPLITWQVHLMTEASFALLSRPLNDPLTVRLSLHPDIPGSIFLSSSSRRHLSRGEDRKRIFEERIIGWSLAIRCHPRARFLINGWEEDDPRAGSVYKHVGFDLDPRRSIIIVGLTILAQFWVSLQCITSLKFGRRARWDRYERCRSSNISIRIWIPDLPFRVGWVENEAIYRARISLLQATWFSLRVWNSVFNKNETYFFFFFTLLSSSP